MKHRPTVTEINYARQQAQLNNAGYLSGLGAYGQDTPENLRRQRELAALSRGETLDEIHDIILKQIQRSHQVSPDQLAHDIRGALRQSGYRIVPS